MLRFLSGWLSRHVPRGRHLRFGLKRDDRGRLRDPRFASFLAETNRKALNTDFQDAVLRGRRWARQALVLGLVVFAAWVAMESARALSVF